jgi:hypothetical protein
VWPSYEFLTVFRTLCLAAFSKNLFINFHIPGSNVSCGKEFGNGRTEIHHDPNGQPRSASEKTDMVQLQQQL